MNGRRKKELHYLAWNEKIPRLLLTKAGKPVVQMIPNTALLSLALWKFAKNKQWLLALKGMNQELRAGAECSWVSWNSWITEIRCILLCQCTTHQEGTI